MSPWKVILATLVIFCSGLVTGAVMVKKFLRQEHPHFQGSSSSTNVSSGWHQQQKEFLRRIEKELDLTEEQRGRIEKLTKESQERTKAIRDKIAPGLNEQMKKVQESPELKEEIKRLREEIRGELTPEQQKKFEQAIKPKFPRKEEKPDEHRKRIKDPTRQRPMRSPSRLRNF